jgi:hypothetical protein
MMMMKRYSIKQLLNSTPGTLRFGLAVLACPSKYARFISCVTNRVYMSTFCHTDDPRIVVVVMCPRVIGPFNDFLVRPKPFALMVAVQPVKRPLHDKAVTNCDK